MCNICVLLETNLILSTDSPEPPAKKQNVEKNKDTNVSWEQIDDERLGLQNQQPGVIAWAKIPGHCWWPGISAFVFFYPFFFINNCLILLHKYEEFFIFFFQQ